MHRTHYSLKIVADLKFAKLAEFSGAQGLFWRGDKGGQLSPLKL